MEDRPTVSFEDLNGCLPAGIYKALIDSAEIKLTKAGTGALLALMMTIFGSSRAGAKLFCNVILKHPSEGAVYYGKKLLKSLLEAVGIDTSGEIEIDPDALVGKKVIAVVTVKDSATWGKQNEVIRFEACPDDATSEESDTENIPF